MPKVAKPCDACGAVFESWPNHGRKYCSISCSRAFGNAGRKVGDWKGGPIQLNCCGCGERFYRWPSQIRAQRAFCSTGCFNADRQNRRSFQCLECGSSRTVKAGQPSRFCSFDCAYSHRRLTREQRAERQSAANRRRRAMLAQVASEAYETSEIGARDKWRCGICRQKIDPTVRWPNVKAPTIDHVVPISGGGDDVRANVQIAHYGCNSSKQNRTLERGEQLRLIG